MKHIIPIVFFVFAITISYGQSKIIEAYISNPQPRLNEGANIIINPSDLTDTILSSLSPIDLLYLSNYRSSEVYLAAVKTNKKGLYNIGSMEFSLNQTKYHTPKFTYEVIDSLPNTDKGLWIRKCIINDSCFWIMIEQRIPYNKKAGSNNKYTVLTYEEMMQTVMLMPVDYENVFMYTRSGNSQSIKTLLIDGVEKQFINSFSYNFFNILDRNAKIIFTKKDFKNIPYDYDFKDIIIK